MRNRNSNIIDRGFNNIGIRPTDNDLGVGATDAFGPLSFTRRAFPGDFPLSFGDPVAPVTERLRSRGCLQDPVVAERRADCALFS